MNTAPFLHIDEFMIVDLGRVVLNPNTDWSIAWVVDKGYPTYSLFYVGPVLQELSTHVLGQYGPRISGVVGALAAATVMVSWLLTKALPKYAAFVLGLVFLLDPIIVQAFTLGRVDGWAMAVSLLSCYILGDINNGVVNRISVNWRIFIAGGLAALAFFIWPSSVLLYPLIILELSRTIYRQWVKVKSLKDVFYSLFLLAVGGVSVCLTLILPIASQLYELIEVVLKAFTTNLRYGPEKAQEVAIKDSAEPILSLLKVLKFSPFLLFFAIVGCILRRDKGLIIAGLVATILVLSTLVYIHRVQYLLPYLIYFVAGVYALDRSAKNTHSFNKLLSWIKVAPLVILLSWSVFISLIARTALALHESSERSRSLISKAANAMIGPGDHAVYLPGPEFYYVGRSLGWRMYRPYAALGDTLSVGMLQKTLPHINYVIMPLWEEEEAFHQQLNQAGLHDAGWYYVYNKYEVNHDDKTTNIDRLRSLFSIPQQPYGPYKLYARKPERVSASAAENTQK